MPQWLLARLFEAKNQSEPEFAFNATVNWMRALAEIVNNESYNNQILANTFSKVKRRKTCQEHDTKVFQNMLMAYSNLASLSSMHSSVSHKYDICTSAVIAWYYATYFSASAMVAAADGSSQETHAATDKAWQKNIVEGSLVPYPFSLHVSSLVRQKVAEQIKTYRGESNTFDLTIYSSSQEEAHGAILSYLKGTADYKKSEEESKIKSSKEFKILGVNDFRKSPARKLRDEKLDQQKVNFLTQSFRYRGKVNYRDSIFLSYGDNDEEKIKQFLKDLLDVTHAFVRMAAFYSSKRVEKGTWKLFVEDIKTNTRLSLGTECITID
jgi:hypothetical protein